MKWQAIIMQITQQNHVLRDQADQIKHMTDWIFVLLGMVISLLLFNIIKKTKR